MNNDSKYARKVRSGRQMYGPGCCAHTVPDSKVQAAREGRLFVPRSTFTIDIETHTDRATRKWGNHV